MGRETSLSSSASTDALAGAPVGVPVVARIRRLVVVALISAFVYSALLSSSKGYCAGGFDGAGGFVDAAGRPTDTAPACLQLTLVPSPIVLAALVVLVVVALNRVISRALDAADAVRVLDRSAAAIAMIAVVSAIVSVVWFWAVPVESWSGPTGFSVLAPFPFGGIDVDISPMYAPEIDPSGTGG